MRRGTDTKVAKDLKAADAKSEYTERSGNITKLLKRLTKALNQHDKDFGKEEKNWGMVGDLGHIESKLYEAVRFLRG